MPRRDRKDLDRDGRRVEDMGRVRGGETKIKMYCIKKNLRVETPDHVQPSLNRKQTNTWQRNGKEREVELFVHYGEMEM